MKKIALLSGVFAVAASGSAYSLFDFESFGATSGGAFTVLLDTDNGLTMELVRSSGLGFDIWDNTPFTFPLQFDDRSLSPFADSRADDYFVANFSDQLTAVELEMTDFGADSDMLVMEVYSGLSGTGTLLATVTSDWGTRTAPSYDALGWSNGGDNSVLARSIKFRGGDGTFRNSMFVDNIAAEAVPEPATLAALGLGAAALLRRRRK